MFREICQFIKENKASVAPFVAFAFPVIIGVAGLGTDASLWMANKRQLQSASDAAVIAAGWEIALDSEQLIDEVSLREATLNGYQPAENGTLDLQIISQNSDGTTLGLTLTQDADSFFSRVVFPDQVRVTSYSEAYIGGTTGQFCILALETVNADSFITSGNVTVSMPDCGIAVNSSSEDAFTSNGNVEINVNTVRITGDYDIGNSVDFTYNSLVTGVPPIGDPYEDLEVPPYPACAPGATGMHISSDTTLSPGVYCGGLQISGSNVIDLDPGVYIIDGGSLDVSGSGELYGEGVTFILTGEGNDYAQVDLTGDRLVTLTAPPAGEDTEGLVFFQDRNAPTVTPQPNRILGTNDIILDGVAYFPSQELRFGGDSSLAGANDPCTKLIARSVTMAGNPRLGNSCDNTAVADIGVPTVRLVR